MKRVQPNALPPELLPPFLEAVAVLRIDGGSKFFNAALRDLKHDTLALAVAAQRARFLRQPDIIGIDVFVEVLGVLESRDQPALLAAALPTVWKVAPGEKAWEVCRSYVDHHDFRVRDSALAGICGNASSLDDRLLAVINDRLRLIYAAKHAGLVCEAIGRSTTPSNIDSSVLFVVDSFRAGGALRRADAIRGGKAIAHRFRADAMRRFDDAFNGDREAFHRFTSLMAK